MNRKCTLLVVLVLFTACNPAIGTMLTATIQATPTKVTELQTATATIPPTPTVTLVPSLTPDTRLPAERWQEWPVIPVVGQEMTAVFQRGIAAGNKPTAFTKIGDGEISTVWFLTQYDLGPDYYHLGSYTDLETVIKYYAGSFGHVSLAAGRGFNTTIILGPVPAGTTGCQDNESRLDCEISTFHPSLAFISLGTNQVWQPEIFEPGLRRIIERLLEDGVVPILSTKADNLEGDGRINRIIAGLAYDYHLPMWNFWSAVQRLPEHGLQPDHEHLTYSYSDFGNPINFKYAWPWRNLTALQTLESLERALGTQP